jgi:hypothetical protein
MKTYMRMNKSLWKSPLNTKRSFSYPVFCDRGISASKPDSILQRNALRREELRTKREGNSNASCGINKLSPTFLLNLPPWREVERTE